MFQKFLAYLNRLFVAPKPAPEPEVTLDTNLMTQIDAQRLENLEKLIAVMAIQLRNFAEEEKKTQEYMVHLSTLHEELLNQLDQGNIAMVKVRRESAEDDMDAMLMEETEALPKKKNELN